MLALLDIVKAGAEIYMEDIAIDKNGGNGLDTATLRLGNAPSLLSEVYDPYITLRPVEYTEKTLLRIDQTGQPAW